MSTNRIFNLLCFFQALEGVIRNVELKAPIQPLVTDAHLSLLWPQPKSLHQLEGLHFRPEKMLHVSVVKGNESVHRYTTKLEYFYNIVDTIIYCRILDIFGVYKDVFDSLGFDVTAQQVEDSNFSSASTYHSSQIQCSINPEALTVPNSYRLHVTSQRVSKMR